MALQVGGSCYATQADAAAAACSQFNVAPFQDATTIQTSTCTGTSFGYLLLVNKKVDKVTNITTTTSNTLYPSFPPCIEQDYLVAAEIIFGGLLGLWAVSYAGMKVVNFLNFTRGSAND